MTAAHAPEPEAHGAPEETPLPPRNLAGAALLVVACGFIATTGLFAKLLGTPGAMQDAPLHPLQVSFARFLFGFLTLLPFALIYRPKFAGTQWRIHAGRTLCGWGGVSAMFAAFALMPMADATAIVFLSPIFAMLLAVLFLSERVGKWRWGAAAAAFAGAVIITRPGTGAFQPAAFIAVLAAVCMGAEYIFIKYLADREPPLRILLINNFFGTLISGTAVLFVWRTPGPDQWLLLAAIGPVMIVAQRFFLGGMALAEASFASPFTYATLIYSALYGYLVFSERLTLSSAIGAGLIIAGALVLGWRERRAKSVARNTVGAAAELR